MKFTKAVSILVIVLAAFGPQVFAADTLIVIFDRQQFVQGDTIHMEVYTEDHKPGPAQTLHLWIDNLETGRRWKYRYPYLKGRYKFSMLISDSIPAGAYAFNFLLDGRFLTVNGKLLNAGKQDSSINFVAKANNRVPVIEGAAVDKAGKFIIDQLLFTDTVLFSFSRPVQKKENPLQIRIETPLDSSFRPKAIATEFIIIGSAAQTASASYNFDMLTPGEKMLQEITLQTKAKKAFEEYIEKNVSGLFGSGEARTFDLLSSDEALSYPDLFSYLTAKIPGLMQRTNPENGQQFITYRNEKVDMYVDEVLDTDFNLSSVALTDVALVRFFNQSFRLGGGIGDDGFGGSVAIYTKRRQGRGAGNKLSNYTFLIKGYNAKTTHWE
jgi:hypothetical protein